MYHFAVESNMLEKDAPFVSFNCADYAQNPQLLFGHIFGIKKGAYTGAAEDSPGLIAKADGGILFLDEILRCHHGIIRNLFNDLQSANSHGYYFAKCGKSFLR